MRTGFLPTLITHPTLGALPTLPTYTELDVDVGVGIGMDINMDMHRDTFTRSGPELSNK